LVCWQTVALIIAQGLGVHMAERSLTKKTKYLASIGGDADPRARRKSRKRRTQMCSLGKGCMACHTLTKNNSDFLWSLEINAFQQSTPHALAMAVQAAKTTRPLRSDAERRLMALLGSTGTKKKVLQKPASKSKQ
jgi:hypothetical protein